jgi:transposase-like protein
MNDNTSSNTATASAGEATSPLGEVISINEGAVKDHLDKLVVKTVEQTLNGLPEAEADQLCGAKRYEHNADRADTRAGHYERQLHTKARRSDPARAEAAQTAFETAIIERYKRRECSVEEALVEMYLAGVSVRRVEDITEALWGTRVSPSTASG